MLGLLLRVVQHSSMVGTSQTFSSGFNFLCGIHSSDVIGNGSDLMNKILWTVINLGRITDGVVRCYNLGLPSSYERVSS